MAIQLIGAASAAKWSITSNELGFRLNSFSVTVTPEVDVPLLKIDGQQDGAAIGDPKGELKMSGEALDLTTASGAALANFYTAFSPVNTSSYFGRSAGGWYIKSSEIKFSRGTWADVDFSATSHFGLA